MLARRKMELCSRRLTSVHKGPEKGPPPVFIERHCDGVVRAFINFRVAKATGGTAKLCLELNPSCERVPAYSRHPPRKDVRIPT
jgi:hypothetical protein